MAIRTFHPTRRRWVPLLMIVGFIALLVSIFLPSYSRYRDEREFRTETWNLNRIGVGLLLYAKDHDGKLPLSLAELVGPYCDELPVSPRAKRLGRYPPGGGPAGGFVYLRPVEKLDAIVSPGFTVTAYTPLAYHEDLGTDVLFYDGHCEWIDRAAAQALLAELQAGHNPPRTAKP
jgi:hypothetical protein